MNCTPNPGLTRRRGFFMKYDWKFKLECVNKYKKGEWIQTPGKTRKQRDSFLSHVLDWVKIYDDLGVEGLKPKIFNKYWTAEQRYELVARVLAGNSQTKVAREAHIPNGQLYQWVKKYKENGITGLQCRQGRPSKEPFMSKKRVEKLTKSEKEELVLLREKYKLLEMENEYLKKLDALVSEREAAEAKVKKQK